MKTHNEMARVFLDIWFYYWSPESEYNRKCLIKGYFESSAVKSASLKSKTNSLIEHDRFFQRVEEKYLQNMKAGT